MAHKHRIECTVCDEPTTKSYHCAKCGEAVCPSCVALNAGPLLCGIPQYLCPSCPGAYCEWYPDLYDVAAT